MPPFLTRLIALSHKEVIHVIRDRQVVYLALGMPLTMVLLFGFAVTFDVQDVNLGVVDHDSSPASRRFLAAMAASDTFTIRRRLDSAAEAEQLFRRGEIKGALIIPPGFERQLARGGRARIQLLMDGADGTTTRIALGYARGVSQQQLIELIRQQGGGASVALPLEPRVRTWFNPRMRSALFVVPGLVALILAMLSVLLSALTVAREWERGSMEQLFTTPVGRSSVVLGKLLPYVGLGLVQTLLVLTAGAWLFDVPLEGSFWLLMGATVLFLVCVLGQGLLISTITRSQQVATQAGAISSMLPSLLLSGFLFPVENMPTFLQWVSAVVPARYFISCLRGIMLQGRGAAQLWPDLLGLAVLGVAVIGICTAKFRRSLD